MKRSETAGMLFFLCCYGSFLPLRHGRICYANDYLPQRQRSTETQSGFATQMFFCH